MNSGVQNYAASKGGRVLAGTCSKNGRGHLIYIDFLIFVDIKCRLINFLVRWYFVLSFV